MSGLLCWLVTFALLEFDKNVFNSFQFEHPLLTIVVEFQLSSLLGNAICLKISDIPLEYIFALYRQKFAYVQRILGQLAR